MREQIKKVFKAIISSKKILISSLGLILLFSLVPLHFAQAGFFDIFGKIFDILFGLPLLIVSGIIISILAIILAVSSLGTAITGAFLSWIINLNIPFTQCAANQANCVVDLGWHFTLSLVNLLFILIFVFIAIATILGLETYGMKKALPAFIGIVLLVNFSRVICGVVVDIAQVIINYFSGTAIDWLRVAGEQWLAAFRTIGESVWGLKIFSLSGQIGLILQILSIIIFGFLVTITLGLYGLVFLARYAIIWVLVILAPLAFAAYILPFTRKWFSQWWNQLLQWSFIGVILVFFLWLARALFLQSSDFGSFSGWEGPSMTWGLESLVGDLVPYFVVLIFLWIGFKAGISGSAMGANMVMNWGKKGSKWVTNWRPTQATLGRAAGTAAGLIGGGGQFVQRLEERGRGKVWGKVVKQTLGRGTRGLETLTVPGLIEYAAKKRRVTLPAGWKQMSIPEKEKHIEALSLDSDKLVLASEMKGEGTFQKASPQFKDKMLKMADKFKEDLRYKKEVGDIMDALPDKVTKDMKIEFEIATINKKEIDAATGRLKRDVEREKLELKISGIVQELGLTGPDAENQAAAILHTKELKPKDMAEVSKGSLKTDIFRLATQKMSSAHLQALQNNFDDETVHAVLEEGKGLNKIQTQAELNEIYNKNQKLVRWAFGTPAGKEMLNWSKRFTEPSGPTTGPTPGPTPEEPTPEEPEANAEEFKTTTGRTVFGTSQREGKKEKGKKEKEQKEEFGDLKGRGLFGKNKK